MAEQPEQTELAVREAVQSFGKNDTRVAVALEKHSAALQAAGRTEESQKYQALSEQVRSQCNDNTTCPFCAETIKATAIKCKHCQSELHSEGASVSFNVSEIRKLSQLPSNKLLLFESEYNRQRKSTLTAYLLLIFLGLFGVHRFYLGEAGWGIIYVALLGTSWAILPVFVLMCLLGIDLCLTADRVTEFNDKTKKDLLAKV